MAPARATAVILTMVTGAGIVSALVRDCFEAEMRREAKQQDLLGGHGLRYHCRRLTTLVVKGY